MYKIANILPTIKPRIMEIIIMYKTILVSDTISLLNRQAYSNFLLESSCLNFDKLFLSIISGSNLVALLI